MLSRWQLYSEMLFFTEHDTLKREEREPAATPTQTILISLLENYSIQAGTGDEEEKKNKKISTETTITLYKHGGNQQ